MQTKTDAAAFAVRVRASHKLGTLTGIRTKDAGRTDREELELSLAGKLWPHSSSNRLMSCWKMANLNNNSASHGN